MFIKVLSLESSLYIFFKFIKQNIKIIIAQICDKFKWIVSLKIQYFQLKNSKINIIQENIIIHKYPKIFLNFTYIESIYNAENNIKNNNEYIIGKGKTGTLKGTGVKGWLYIISIQ